MRNDSEKWQLLPAAKLVILVSGLQSPETCTLLFSLVFAI